MEQGLTLEKRGFTMEAWIKRGVRGTPPSPPPQAPNPPPPPRLAEGRRRRHLLAYDPTDEFLAAAAADDSDDAGDGSKPRRDLLGSSANLGASKLLSGDDSDLSKLRLPAADAPSAGSTDAQMIVHKSGVSALGDSVFVYYLAAGAYTRSFFSSTKALSVG